MRIFARRETIRRERDAEIADAIAATITKNRRRHRTGIEHSEYINGYEDALKDLRDGLLQRSA